MQHTIRVSALLAAVFVSDTPATSQVDPNGTHMATTQDTKIKKPSPEFRLFPHAVGQWAKKINGKKWNLGTISDSDAASRKYLDEVDEIQAGRDPRSASVVRLSSNELTVADLCGLFLERQQTRVTLGEITSRHFSDCLKSCRRPRLVVTHIFVVKGCVFLVATVARRWVLHYPPTKEFDLPKIPRSGERGYKKCG